MSRDIEEEVGISFGGADEISSVVRWDRKQKTLTVEFGRHFWESTPHKELKVVGGGTVHEPNIDRIVARLRQVCETGDMK